MLSGCSGGPSLRSPIKSRKFCSEFIASTDQMAKQPAEWSPVLLRMTIDLL
jgi:hypothetical protein